MQNAELLIWNATLRVRIRHKFRVSVRVRDVVRVRFLLGLHSAAKFCI